jgi:hypothetical protein
LLTFDLAQRPRLSFVAHAIHERADRTTPAKPATRAATIAAAKCPALMRAVCLTERQFDGAGEVKPLPQRPWARMPDS